MMTTNRFTAITAAFAGIFVTALAVSASSPAEPAEKATTNVSVARGEYLVTTSGCHDCHTPWKMGANGPEPDMTRALTGHPADFVMPPAPKLPAGPWIWMGSATNTAFAGPWGTSFAANLTPDKATGTGDWTVEQFIATLRTGRRLGKGRPVLPPMPAAVYAKMTDDDLRSIFAYLQSLKPVSNKVPQPVEPAEGGR
jgi:mono/diheme cytochrome c family protein